MADRRFLILFVEDNPVERTRIRAALASDPNNRWTVQEAATLDAALTLARTEKPDCLLITQTLLDFESNTLVRFTGDSVTVPIAPVVVLGMRSVPAAVQAMRQGVHDYLVRDVITPEGLRRALCNTIEKESIARRLRDSERRFAALFDQTIGYVWLLRPDGTVLDVNRSALNFAGVDREEVLGQQFWGMKCWSYGSRQQLREAIGAGAASRFTRLEIDATGAAGQAATLDLSLKPVCDEPGQVILLMLEGRDISQRKRAEEVILRNRDELEERVRKRTEELAHANDTLRAEATERLRHEEELAASEARYRLLAENARDMISRHAPDGRILYCSPAGAALLGMPLEKLIGADLLTLVHLEDREIVRRELEALPHTSGDRLITYRACRSDGMVVWFETTLHAVSRPSDCGKEVYEVVAVTRDVTERRRLEEQFWLAQKMEAVGRLAGGVAHDFNNLLTAILGYSELLLDGCPPGESRDNLREIQHAAQRASDLTQQLLAFSRKQVLTPRRIDLNSLVDDMGKLLRRLIGEDIELVTHLHPGLPVIEADPGQIEQVLMNLAINARDAMPEGGRLTINTAPDSDTGDVVLSVVDTGIGMNAEVRARIFEPFFTTKEAGKGTGLGLATVYAIIKQSGGRIDVESTPGRGTRFIVKMPACGDRDNVKSEAGPTPGAVPYGTGTVLLVEDEEQVRTMARMALQRFGFTVLEARDGLEAEALASRHGGQIDLLLTDVVMPRLGGRELAERLTPRRPGMKVLFVSGYAESLIPLRPGEITKNSFLQKPFLPLELARKVRQMLDN